MKSKIVSGILAGFVGINAFHFGGLRDVEAAEEGDRSVQEVIQRNQEFLDRALRVKPVSLIKTRIGYIKVIYKVENRYASKKYATVTCTIKDGEGGILDVGKSLSNIGPNQVAVDFMFLRYSPSADKVACWIS